MSLLADGTAERSRHTLTDLRSLLALMASQDLAEIVIGGVRDSGAFTGIPAPVLAGERWRVPGDHPGRDHLVEVLSDLGAQVLKTARPNLTARVVGQSVEREEATYDLEPYLAELRRRAADGSGAYVRGWIEEQLARHKVSADVPLGEESGSSEWEEIMAFVPRDPELAPGWRWTAKGYKGNPKAWRHLDVPEEDLAGEEDLAEREDDEEEDWLAAEEVPVTEPVCAENRPEALTQVAAIPHAVAARRAAVEDRNETTDEDVRRPAVAPPVVLPGSRPGAGPRGSGQQRRRWPSGVFTLVAIFFGCYATWATIDAFRGESGALPSALILWVFALGFGAASRRRRSPR